MWLITNFGFFSIVEKPNQKGQGMLTIRARAKADLEALRAKYLPAMGPIEADKGTDYKYRAVAPAAQVARGRRAPAGPVLVHEIEIRLIRDLTAEKLENPGGARQAIRTGRCHRSARSDGHLP